MTAVKTLKAGIAPGPDNLQPEIFLHRDESALNGCEYCSKTANPQRVSKKVSKSSLFNVGLYNSVKKCRKWRKR